MPPKSAQPKSFPVPPQRAEGSSDEEYASGDEALAENMPGPDEVADDGSMKRDSGKKKSASSSSSTAAAGAKKPSKIGGTTWDRILEAFEALQSRKGLSSQKLKSYICDKYGIDKGNARFLSLFRRTLKAGVEANHLTRVDQTFKLMKSATKKKTSKVTPKINEGEQAKHKAANGVLRHKATAGPSSAKASSAVRKSSKDKLPPKSAARQSSKSPLKRSGEKPSEKRPTSAAPTSVRTTGNAGKKGVKQESADPPKERVKKTITKKRDTGSSRKQTSATK